MSANNEQLKDLLRKIIEIVINNYDVFCEKADLEYLDFIVKIDVDEYLLGTNGDEEISFSIFLNDAGNYPYNSWETTFFEGDFILERTLEFRMDKEYSEYEKRYNIMLKIIFDLTSELNEEAILVSNGDTELCFFRENKPILLNNESGIWNRECFKDFIANRDVCYIAGNI